MHCTVFGGEESSYTDCSDAADKNKNSVVPLPACFLHDSDQLIDLAYASPNNSPSDAVSQSAPSLAYSALSGLVRLNGSNLSSVSSSSSSNSNDTTNPIEIAKKVFQKRGNVFYAASTSFDEISKDIADQRAHVVKQNLKELSGEDFGVLNVQHVAKHVYLSVVTCMKHGASLVPCLLLGDDVLGINHYTKTFR